jgi:hypothetical protein
VKYGSLQERQVLKTKNMQHRKVLCQPTREVPRQRLPVTRGHEADGEADGWRGSAELDRLTCRGVCDRGETLRLLLSLWKSQGPSVLVAVYTTIAGWFVVRMFHTSES